jgi:DedD protein
MRLPFFRNKPTAPPAGAAGPAAGGDAAVQAARTAARRRLVGALVLLLIGVVGFPLLFETQPRPLPADLPILVPEGTVARVPPRPAAPAPRPPAEVPADAGAEPVTVAAAPSAPPAAPAKPVVAPTPAPTPEPAASAAAPPAPKPAAPTLAAVPPPAAAPKPAPPASAAAGAGRFVVQVGAFNEAERLKAARQRVEKLGFKSYTQDVDTATGKRTRVRVGPFASRQEAEAAAGKLKAAGLAANVLSL